MAKELAPSVFVHAWNADKTQLAFSPNNEDVLIYDTSDSNPEKWTQLHHFQEHDGPVSGIDWCHATNKIVTCGHDRNAFVWTWLEDENKWDLGLVLLRVNKSVTSVKWSPNGTKFAVTTGAKSVVVCYYDKKNKWWLGKSIKERKEKGKSSKKSMFKSTVTCLDWSPNSKLLVTGSTDSKCRIFSAWNKLWDTKEDDNLSAVWPHYDSFGELLLEVKHGSWINTVSWSPDGMRLFFAGHGSTANFIQLSPGGGHKEQTIYLRGKPLMSSQFLSPSCVAAAGFEMNPLVFGADGDEWSLVGKADKADVKTEKKATSSVSAARSMWGNRVSRGVQKGSTSSSSDITTTHKSYIMSLEKIPGAPKQFSCASLDGIFKIWDLTTLSHLDTAKYF